MLARWIRFGPTAQREFDAAYASLAAVQPQSAAPIVLWAEEAARYPFALIAPRRLAPGRESRWLSWGLAAAYPLPQIYRTDAVMAKQWYGLSLYTKNLTGSSMWIMGSLTQSTACAQVGCSAQTANTPSQGWTQLWNAVNCKYFTTSTCPTGQTLTYSTDMSWTD